MVKKNQNQIKRIDPCLLCEFSTFEVIYRKDKWQYLQCQKCGLVSIYPKPSKIGVLNNYETYLPTDIREIKKWEAMMRPVIETSVKIISARTKISQGRLLDIGCGYGFFLNAMKQHHWEVTGIEISKDGRQYARHQYGIDVYSKPLETLSLPDGYFDAVTLFYVIEHIADPLTVLNEVKRILKPGGLVLIRWPHTTPIIKMLGPLSKRLDLYHTPYHLYDFSKQTIERVLTLSGLADIKTMVGGYTLSPIRINRWPSIVFGLFGEMLFRISGGKFLLPGISKTTVAVKPSLL
jgi:SAM-dependent methyltransferase